MSGDASPGAMFDHAGYRDFIANKATKTHATGFEMHGAWPGLFEHQRRTLEFACRQGRSAAFLDTGLGKSRVEAAFAEEARIASGRPSLILTPLAVARQMQRECEAIGVEARVIREDADVWSGVNIANYERIPKIDVTRFGGVVLDESSILKSFSGPTKTMLVRAFADTPYRLAATATPAPNDHMELGTHSEFLGYLGSMEMLCRWFVNDTSTASQDWRIKGHAEADFWAWVASWSRAASLPSDLGGDDTGFILPPLSYELHHVASDLSQDTQGLLFRIPDNSATSIHKEKRLTLNDRIAKCVDVVIGSFSDKLAAWHGNQNTLSGEDFGRNPTLNIEPNETHRGTATTPKSGPNTCGLTTAKIETSGSEAERLRISSTPGGESDTNSIRALPSNAAHPLDPETQKHAGLDASCPIMDYPPKTSTGCSPLNQDNAQSATENLAASSTSIIATSPEKSEACFARPATRRSAKCATIQKGSDARSFTYSAPNLDPWLIFCETNGEQDALEAAFGDLCISVRGADSPEKKEADIDRWLNNERPVFISKPSIVGYGLNFQHCQNVVFVSISHSYERFYQAVRRVWRFGQTKPVTIHMIMAETERPIWANVRRKADDHDKMKRVMASAMVGAQRQAEGKSAYVRAPEITLPKFMRGSNAS